MQIIRNKKVPFIELKVGTEKEYSVRKHSHKEISIGIIEKGSTNVSDECGFFDQSHFVKTFKQYFGMNPQDYRR
jgi:AraC-like DNA-binding protein